MNLLIPVLLAPLFFALEILVLRRFAGVMALSGGVLSLLASLGLLVGAYQGMNTALILPGLPHMPLRLEATPLTALLSAMVAIIGTLVLIYAVGYMKKDKEQARFFATLLLFISAMQLLVLSADWLLLLAAWELIGFCSYLLIGFWYQKPGVKSAATRAFLYTRSADLGLYLGVFVLIVSTGSSDIASSLEMSGEMGGNAAIFAGLLLLLAAMGKSAQTPFHSWLQGAMAGPTPVSALLHSATLVAAGAILLIRTSPMLPPQALLVIGIVGGITTVVTGLIALGEKDLKRLLAASTSSQYGLMLLAIGAGIPMAALLHLLAHAAIKSSLFLGAGVFQHSRGSTTFAKLQGVGRDHPKLFLGFALAALALAGIPPLSGFFSKDAIIAASLASPDALLLTFFAIVGTVLTGTYMARTLRILWRGEAQSRDTSTGNSSHITGLNWMTVGVTSLVAIAVVLGFAFPSIEALLSTLVLPLPESQSLQTLAQVLGLTAAIIGLTLGWFIGGRRLLGPLLSWSQQSFSVAGGFDAIMVRPALTLAKACELLERRLYNGALALGQVTLNIGHANEFLERRLYNGVLALGQATMKIGRAVRFSDDRGIDGAIFSLVRNTLALGERARTLQSGLIHREMAITVIGTALILIALLVTLLIN